MHKATTRALALVTLLHAGPAAADYDDVTIWAEKYRSLEKATDLAVGVNTNGYGFDLDIPEDFKFRFYGEDITYIRPHGYGVIGFRKDEYISYANRPLPYNGSPYGVIAPFWETWDRSERNPFDGGITYKIEGEGDEQVLKVQWQNYPYYYCYTWSDDRYDWSCGHMKHFSFQVWIHESNGVDDSLIQFHYAPILNPDGGLNFYETNYGYNFEPYNNLSGTVGVEDRTRTRATYGLECGNTCRLKDWPADQVILFGQPASAELLAIPDVESLTSDDTSTTLVTTTSLRNIGAMDAQGLTFAYYLSTDDLLDTGRDTLVGTHDPAFDLAAGSSVALDDRFVAERPSPGWYHACVLADPAETIEEAFESNNRACSTEKYIVGVDFDGSIRVPEVAGPGDEMPVTVGIANLGLEPADLTFRLLLSADTKPSDDDLEIYRRGEGDPLHLNGHEAYSEDLSLFIPADALGPHENEMPRFVLMQYDPDGRLLEADESNNLEISEPVVLVKADLRVTGFALDLPDGCFFGRPASVTMDISNEGAARARGFDNAFVLSDNGILTNYDQAIRLSPAHCIEDVDCAGTLGDAAYCMADVKTCTKDCLGDSDCVNPLGVSEGLVCLAGQCRNFIGPYEEMTVSFTEQLPVADPNGAPLVDGTYYFGAITDFYDQVNEGNEANNARPLVGGTQCQAPAPDFIAVSVKVPATAAAGEQLPVRRVIRNRGNVAGSVTWKYYLSSNDVLSDHDIELSFGPNGGGVTTLDPEQLDEATDIALLPSGLAAGVYHVGLRLDVGQVVHELSDDNNTFVASGTVDILAAALRVGTSVLPPATLQVTYHRQLVATGGAGVYTWKATSPPLPPGMRLDGDGILTGRPTEEGSYVLGVRVHSGGYQADALLHLAVLPPTGPLTVATERLPPAYLDVPYRVELAAVGGKPPYAWSIVGRLPQGISLKNDTLTGTPELADGTSAPRAFKVRVRDSLATEIDRELTLPVLRSADLSIQTTRVQDGLVGQPYQQILRAAGGEPPYEFTITGLAGTGLASNGNSDTTALISGVPETSGYFEMSVRVLDQVGQQVSQTFKFAVIGQAIQVQTDRALPFAAKGKPYPETQLIAAEADVRWQIYAGDLPPGMSLSSDGVLSGVVAQDAQARTYTFLARAFDDRGSEGFGAFSIPLLAEQLAPKYRVTKTGCGSNASGGSPTALLLLSAALLLRWRRG